MSQKDENLQSKNTNNLVTERDIDPDFGLFTEDSFPEALKMKINERRSNMPFLKKRLLINPLRIIREA